MMGVLEQLIGGNAEVVRWFQNARQLWEEIDQDVGQGDPAALQQAMHDRLWRFEHECGGRDLGQEVMAYVGVGRFHSTAGGFEDNIDAAKAVYQGLLGISATLHDVVCAIYPELNE